jgi:hypothetical protein
LRAFHNNSKGLKKMKKVNIVLSVLVILFLSVSLVPPVSAQASPDDIQNTYLAKPKEPKEVLVKIVNNSNRYIYLYLDHRREFHVYNLSVPPGINQYWLYSGPYKYEYYSCGRSIEGHTTFKPKSKLRIGCPERRSHNDP